MIDYAELHCLSNFSFLRGASHAEELVQRAIELGYKALAITDECSLAGVVRAYLAARESDSHLKLIVGSEFVTAEGMHFVLLATNRQSYGRISALITQARRLAKKGEYYLDQAMLVQADLMDCLLLWVLPTEQQLIKHQLDWLKHEYAHPHNVWLSHTVLLEGNDEQNWELLVAAHKQYGFPMVATGHIHMHSRGRRALQDVLTALRLNSTVQQLGAARFSNGERHLRSRQRLAELYPNALLQETLNIAERCQFSLKELCYEYPQEVVPQTHTPTSWLRELTLKGMHERWPNGIPTKVRQQVEHELQLIAELSYEPFFLTVYDVVIFARSKGILCQGRGSAANSAVCYCLGITSVDPDRMNLLFERFISKERNEPPDIDVDFEHERREEVIQYIYNKYGRDRAALAATVISYRSRSAIRDVARALGFRQDMIDQLNRLSYRWDRKGLTEERLADAGLQMTPMLHRMSVLVNEIMGFPRHLSQHVGGFVIARGQLAELVPTENATMVDRTVIQWDKDDLETLGLLKVDVLALGMLSCIRKAFEYIRCYTGKHYTLANIPAEDPEVYKQMHRGDTVGVFQIESRAQMSMLPRLRPANFYDLVIQIAIVRPGPIQGDMVHPYLRRRNGEERIDYPSDAVKGVLERTLGVPIFQEQVMQLAIVAAGFTPGEADHLRRSMAAWKKKGGLDIFEERLHTGMKERGYSDDFAQRIYQQILGFGDYGFPESHSASFALLAYASSWLKRYYHAAFTCALINSLPMGFYAPAQLIQDASRHNIDIHPFDVNCSEWDCTLESNAGKNSNDITNITPSIALAAGWVTAQPTQEEPALRLGLRLVKGLSREAAERLCLTRNQSGPFASVADMAQRAQLNKTDMEALAAANALSSIVANRHRAFWQVLGTDNDMPLFPAATFNEPTAVLRKALLAEEVLRDYETSGLSLQEHPMRLIRERLNKERYRTASELWDIPSGSLVRVAGLVIGRQRPGTASGIVFVTLEDETGHTNVVVWGNFAHEQRQALLESKILSVTGTVEQKDNVLHLIAGRLENLNEYLEYAGKSRDFH